MKKSILLGIAAALLILTADLESTGAYFTTYAEAGGGMRIDLGAETELRERFSVWTKHISVVSKENSEPVFVRVKAFCGSAYQLVYNDASSKWSLGDDGYYYYQDILYGGTATEELSVKIQAERDGILSNLPADADPADFNVIVVYECTPVHYRENGEPYADWAVKVETGSTAREGGK